MPYTSKQCRKFGSMAGSKGGSRPPADWKQHCSTKNTKKKPRRKK